MNQHEQIVANYVRIVAGDRVTLEEGEAAQREAVDHAKGLQDRVEDSEARRAAITRRRLGGESSGAETAEYAALGGDLEVLRELLTDARKHAQAEDQRVEDARGQLTHDERELQRAQAFLEFQAVVEHAKVVEDAYRRCLRAVWDAARKTGHQRTFAEAFQIDAEIQSIVRFGTAPGEH